jgi:serine/threonine-protein kinase HipA
LKCLIVSRFDRREAAPGAIPERVHQEDICQAMGIDATAVSGRAKYERAGGPGFKAIAALLISHAEDTDAQLARLAQIMTFNVLIGNADAQGKNIALLHEPLDSVALAPLYDTVPTMLWLKLRPHSAMRVNGREHLGEITLEDMIAEAAAWPYSRSAAAAAIAEVISDIAQASAELPMPENLRVLVGGQAERLLAGR